MANSPLQLENYRYLFVIEDDAIQNEMLKDYLKERYLFDVKTFQNGESALSEIKHLQPELIVLDYHLNAQNAAAKNGIEVLQQIKIDSPHTKVILFSGEDKLEVALESMKHGAYDYIIKGKTAFNKLEQSINKLGEIHRLEAIASSQKKSIFILLIGIILIAIFAILYAMGTFGDALKD